MTATPDSGRDTAGFAFLDRTVVLKKPSEGQSLILLNILDLGSDAVEVETKVRSMHEFSLMLRTLFVQPADVSFVMTCLATERADSDDFIGLAEQMLNHWMPVEASNRQERRAGSRTAAKKAPAKKVAATRRPAVKR